tara:strand:+ start:756 stop:1007 length:252 start_codon:yes stop_codon:yes gene_type:complete
LHATEATPFLAAAVSAATALILLPHFKNPFLVPLVQIARFNERDPLAPPAHPQRSAIAMVFSGKNLLKQKVRKVRKHDLAGWH